jgi:transposase-like protein
MYKLEFKEYIHCEDCGEVVKTTFICPLCQSEQVAAHGYFFNSHFEELTCKQCRATFLGTGDESFRVFYDADSQRKAFGIV